VLDRPELPGETRGDLLLVLVQVDHLQVVRRLVLAHVQGSAIELGGIRVLREVDDPAAQILRAGVLDQSRGVLPDRRLERSSSRGQVHAYHTTSPVHLHVDPLVDQPVPPLRL
jgi:hypothetical protein